MKENTSYKIVALLITVILWVIILGSKEAVSVRLVNVDFLLPKSMVITNSVPHEIAFKVAGSRLALKKFNESHEPLVVDLSAAPEGFTTVRLHPDSINVPAGVRVLTMSPSSFTPKLEPVVSRVLPVDINFRGELPMNKKLIRMKAHPAEWEVYGAKSVLDALKSVGTVPLDLSQIKKTQNIELELVLNDFGLDKNKNKGRVQVEIVIE